MTRRVCASMPAGNGALSSAGSVGIWPVTKTQPSDATAWLVGATGVGAPGIIRNSIIGGHSPRVHLAWLLHIPGQQSTWNRRCQDMTTHAENELLTHVGPGTPMGALMR